MPRRDGDDEAVPMMFPSELARVGSAGRPPDQGMLAGEGFALRVARTGDPAAPAEVHVLRQPRVVIGRSSSCDVRLDDPQRIVSSRHAEIRLTDGGAVVVDLGSKNLTLLNGEALTAEQPHPLRPGDEVTIGDFTIRIDVSARRQPSEETVFAPDSVNPFEDDARRLAELLAALAARWSETPPANREAALTEALERALERVREEPDDAHRAVVRAVVERLRERAG